MNDDELTTAIADVFGVRVHPFAGMDTIDAWAERDGKMVAYIERKTRNVTRDAYPTAVVDARKWLGLLSAEYATGTPAILAYAWSCGAWGIVRPSSAGPITTRILTPGPESVSLNAGVPRPVVDVPLSAFVMYGTAVAA